MTRHASSFVAEIVLKIERTTAPAYVQAVVRQFVRTHGTAKDEWSVAIAASEAATNIAKFATRGTLIVRVCDGAFELVAEDDGPGFDDPEAALRDHVSEGVDLSTGEPPAARRGLGTGLGAIARAMHESLSIERRHGGGTRLVARRPIKR